mmetsp:Transcript_6732/g.8522  ORF Transcript_6732/g.8522 Transcript_6732/m.8522 type:complete len:249 (-) Transcript_6732:911-1657(-)
MVLYDTNLNPLHEIVLTSLALGAIAGTSLTLCIVQTNTKFTPLLVYLMILCVYFFNEFCSTAKYQTKIVKAKLFLIWGNNGNKEFLLIQTATIWEFLFTRSLFYGKLLHAFFGITFKKQLNPFFIVLGLMMIVVGLFVRTLAMKTCGTSFSHYIETANRQQKLITTGIYAWFRHPSYLGFWLFAIGSQIFLGNYIGLIINIGILSWFFKRRIEFEEWFLIHRIFGDQYLQYRKNVGNWIPFVILKKDL